MARSRVTFPDGTVVEIAKDTPPAQIQAILSTLRNINTTDVPVPSSTGQVIKPELTPEEIWADGSKKEKLALFIRNHFLHDQWFTATEIRDQQLEFVKRLVFGESSAIATYLSRLHDDGLLHKAKRGKYVAYRLSQQIQENYPEIQLPLMTQLLSSE